MPELQDSNTSAFNAPPIDVNKLKYREKSVAKQRELMKANKEAQPKVHRKNKPWSKAKDARQKKLEKRQKRLNKATVAKQEPTDQSSKDTCASGRDDDMNDIDELNEDYRLLKRARKRKVILMFLFASCL
ncbi:unnamed protein product [Echinostoma caproni]|uniref:SURF6 domain-containing protein n=1 Tax=Echinostoma caproni TaxID=27848 RepID=A0A183BDG0_9TREM|nr:unnamed protein product [Echinostoma caproni]